MKTLRGMLTVSSQDSICDMLPVPRLLLDDSRSSSRSVNRVGELEPSCLILASSPVGDGRGRVGWRGAEGDQRG